MHERNIKLSYTASKPAVKKKITAAMLSIVISICLFGCQKKDSAYFLEEAASASHNTKMQETETQMTETQAAGTFITGTDRQQETQTAVFFVYVCGAVKAPGVYKLEQGSRVFEAILLAGGFCEDACEEYVNQAQEIADAMKIYVPTAAQVENGEWGPSEGNLLQTKEENAGKPALVNINTADAATLTTLPGIGESRAEAIVDYRESSGGFERIEDIMKVSGIKEGAFQKIKDKICVK